MDKQQKKEFKKVWKTLKTAFRWLLLAILIFLLLSLLRDFLDSYNFLIEKVNQQGDQINYLNGQLQEVTAQNVQLSEQLQLTQAQLELQDMRIDEVVNERLTQQAPKVYISNEPVSMTQEELEQEIKPQLKPNDPSWVPVAVVGVLQVLKSLVFRVPAF